MLRKRIKFTDYEGVEREEDFYFNLNRAELMKMQMAEEGGLKKRLEKILQAKDGVAIAEHFMTIIKESYGEKSPDGKRFEKVRNGVPLFEQFEQTEAYVELYVELTTDEKAAAAFVEGITESSRQKPIPVK